MLRRVALDVAAGEAVCLVGRNGSGKSTTLRTIMGYRRPAAGTITFNGEPIGGQPTHAIAARGVGFSPEDSGIFADLSVAENIEIATWTRPAARPAAERIALAYEIFPRLRGVRRSRRHRHLGRRAQDAVDRPRARAGPRLAVAR